MPDESCRTCGGELISQIKCEECRKSTQRVCKMCGIVTEQEYHQNCLHILSLKTRNGMQMEIITTKQHDHKTMDKNNIKTNLSLQNLLLVFSIIGFFVLGFATSGYFNMYQNHTIDTQLIKSNLSMQNILLANYSILNTYENCLGYGRGESITVTCPTEKGYVYKTTLAMPHDLVTKLTTADFSIRSISISENPDGSVFLKYQKNLYATTFFT